IVQQRSSPKHVDTEKVRFEVANHHRLSLLVKVIFVLRRLAHRERLLVFRLVYVDDFVGPGSIPVIFLPGSIKAKLLRYALTLNEYPPPKKPFLVDVMNEINANGVELEDPDIWFALESKNPVGYIF